MDDKEKDKVYQKLKDKDVEGKPEDERTSSDNLSNRGFDVGKEFDIWTLGNDELGTFGHRNSNITNNSRTISNRFYTDSNDAHNLNATNSQRVRNLNDVEFLSSTQIFNPLVSPLVEPSPRVHFDDELTSTARIQDLTTAVTRTPAAARDQSTILFQTFDNSRSVASHSCLNLIDLLAEHVVLHPLISLRRVCQVNRKCSPFICVQPIPLMPFMYHIYQRQGLSTLFKGLSSELAVKTLLIATETAIAEYTHWPHEFTSKNSFRNWPNHLSLKCLSFIIATPFFCSSAIETIHSSMIAQDHLAFVECIREAMTRLLHLTCRPSNRLLPIWALVPPTLAYHMSYLVLYNFLRKFIECFKYYLPISIFSLSRTPLINDFEFDFEHDTSLYKRNQGRRITHQPATQREALDNECSQISTNILAHFLTSFSLFPMETVMHSLYVQGTRTIVDNCDETTVVLPIITNYDGMVDCYQSIVKQEGNLGLYKGLGALFLQFGLRYMILRMSHYVLSRIKFGSSNTIVSPSFSSDDHPRSLNYARRDQEQFDNNYAITESITPKNVTTIRHNNSPAVNQFGRNIGAPLKLINSNNNLNFNGSGAQFSSSTPMTHAVPKFVPHQQTNKIDDGLNFR